jgi:hypothetical protein
MVEIDHHDGSTVTEERADDGDTLDVSVDGTPVRAFQVNHFDNMTAIHVVPEEYGTQDGCVFVESGPATVETEEREFTGKLATVQFEESIVSLNFERTEDN